MLYKKFFKLTMFLFVAGVLLSCNETDKPDAAPVLTIAAESLTQAFGQETGIKFVTVTSNQEFTATPNQAWVTADVLNTESSNLKITVEANTGDARSAEITVSAQGVADIKITVNQAAYEEEIVDHGTLSINAEDENLEIALAGTTKFILVTASKAFTATSNKSWAEVTVVENNPEYNLRIIVGENSGIERTALITLSAADLPDVVITVSQARTNAPEIAFEMTDWIFDTNGTWMRNGDKPEADGHTVRKIFDENTTTYWNSIRFIPEWLEGTVSRPETGWIKLTKPVETQYYFGFDMLGLKEISAIEIMMRYHLNRARIEASDNGTEWRVIGKLQYEGANVGEETRTFTEKFVARYVRIYGEETERHPGTDGVFSDLPIDEQPSAWDNSYGIFEIKVKGLPSGEEAIAKHSKTGWTATATSTASGNAQDILDNNYENESVWTSDPGTGTHSVVIDMKKAKSVRKVSIYQSTCAEGRDLPIFEGGYTSNSAKGYPSNMYTKMEDESATCYTGSSASGPWTLFGKTFDFENIREIANFEGNATAQYVKIDLVGVLGRTDAAFLKEGTVNLREVDVYGE